MSVEFSRDFLIEVQKGNISGHSMVHKFGKNPAVGGSFEHVSQLPFATTDFRQSAAAMRVKSGGNAADTAAGAGAREVTIQGIDSAFAETSEAVATAGASASPATTATFWRVHRAWVSATGTYGGNNTGDVVIEDSGGTADMLHLEAGEGQSQYCGWTVPLAKTAYLLSVHVTVTVGVNQQADIRCFTRADIADVSAPMPAKRLKLFWAGVQESFTYAPSGPELSLPAKSDIWFEATAGTSSEVSIDFELLLVDD